MMKWIGKLVIRFPKIVIAVVVGLTLLLGYFIPQIKFNNDARDFIPPSDPERQYNEQMQEIFGNDDVVYIGFVMENVYTPKKLAKVAKLTSLLKDIEGVDDVTSLATVKNIEGTSGGMNVYKFVDEENLPENAEDAQNVRAQLEKWDVLVNNLVSADGKATSIVVRLQPNASITIQARVFKAVRTIINQNQEPGESYHYSGYTAINVLLGEYMVQDIRNLLPVAFVVVAGSLFLSFRKLKGVLLPLINVGIAVIWTIGLMALLKVPLSLPCTAIPVILVSVGTAYAIHIIRDYYDEIRRGLAKDEIFAACFSKIGIAVMLSGLTTVAGFATLYSTKVVPIRDFGVFSAFGTLVALVLALIFVPAVLYLEKLPGEKEAKPADQPAANPGVNHKLTHTQVYRRAEVTFAIKHRKFMLIAGIVVIAIAGWGASKLFVNDNGVAYFREGTQVRNDDAVLAKYFGGTHLFSVIVTGPAKDSVKEPTLLKNMEGLQQDIQAQFPAIGKTMSIADYLKKMNMAMNENDSSYYKLPDTRELVAQYLLTYESGGDSDDFNSVVDYEYQKARIVILSKDGNTTHTQKVVDEIYAYAQAHFDQRYQVRVTGGGYTPLVMDRYVVTGQMNSIITSIVTVWMLTCIIFRSLIGGLVTIIPLSVTVLINFAIMGFLVLIFSSFVPLIRLGVTGHGCPSNRCQR